jgi:uncharacterized protein (DUF1697 family)
MPMTGFIALLRGINVGGNKKVPMAMLKKALEKAGYENVKTLLASGNVTFEAGKKTPEVLRKELEALLQKTFGFSIPTLVRTQEQIDALLKSNPFKGVPVTKETRLYVTFLSEKPTTKLKIPYTSPEGNFRILRVTEGEVCSVLTITAKAGTVDVMKILEQEFGKNVTTRNWNTVQKLGKA